MTPSSPQDTFFRNGKIGVKVSIIVNCLILIVMAVGTYILIARQSESLESELLSRGQTQATVGAKMISKVLEEAIDNGVFSVTEAFDTEYMPIGNFTPPKFHTRYDTYMDKAILGLQDEFLLDTSVVYAVAVDKNGYLPTHNSRYQNPITGDVEKDRAGNQTKRVFNAPVELTAAKKKLMLTLLVIMGTILVLSIILTTAIVSRSLALIRILFNRADNLAHGKNLQDEILATRQDEIGELQESLNRLRMSMLIALKMKNK